MSEDLSMDDLHEPKEPTIKVYREEYFRSKAELDYLQRYNQFCDTLSEPLQTTARHMFNSIYDHRHPSRDGLLHPEKLEKLQETDPVLARELRQAILSFIKPTTSEE